MNLPKHLDEVAGTSATSLTRHLCEGSGIKKLVWIFIAARAAYAGTLTAAQYWVWTHSGAAGRVFADSPIVPNNQELETTVSFLSLFNFPHGYFTFYALSRFWLNFGISATASLAFYAVLIFISRLRPGSFTNTEISLGLLCALLAGWPGILIFIPLALASALILGIFAQFSQRNENGRVRLVNVVQRFVRLNRNTLETMYLPFLLAFTILFVWRLFGDPFSFFHFSVLKI